MSTGASGWSRERLEQVAELLRVARVLDVEVDAERLAHRREAVELLLVRRRVDAVDGRDVALLAPAGDDLVGQEHQLLDELVGLLDARVAGAAHDVDRLARRLVEDDLRLGQLEVERAALHPLRAQVRATARSATRSPSTIASASGSRVASLESPSARATPP